MRDRGSATRKRHLESERWEIRRGREIWWVPRPRAVGTGKGWGTGRQRSQAAVGWASELNPVSG